MRQLNSGDVLAKYYEIPRWGHVYFHLIYFLAFTIPLIEVKNMPKGQRPPAVGSRTFLPKLSFNCVGNIPARLLVKQFFKR